MRPLNRYSQSYDEHVGPVTQRGLDRRCALVRFGEHGDLAFERQRCRERLAEEGLVVGEHHGGHRSSSRAAEGGVVTEE
ncbi:hypothetical protein [Streptomyces sp. BA2]|uniref:hypothetical protein n=1 Tax=Streptomyces sp. BA2 TaxID=436595 RepID=UPI0019214C4D|nr:hypothetical protein [Streptomyces sp. BA2]